LNAWPRNHIIDYANAGAIVWLKYRGLFIGSISWNATNKAPGRWCIWWVYHGSKRSDLHQQMMI